MNQDLTQIELIDEPCIVCRTVRKDMLLILEKPVCTCCEQEIVETDWYNLEKYLFHVSRLKEIWLNENDLREEGTY